MAGWATYQGNANLNGIWVSAAEVALSKAEAYLMGYGVGADAAKAKQCFINGVVLSNEYYWDMKLGSSLAKDGNDGYVNARFKFQRQKEVGRQYEHVANCWPLWERTDVIPMAAYEKLKMNN